MGGIVERLPHRRAMHRRETGSMMRAPYRPREATRTIVRSLARERIQELLAACDRLLQVEIEIAAMGDCPERDWFLNKPGHRDAFTIAHALKELLG